MHYRNRILKEIISAIEKNETVQENIDLRKAIAEVYKVWKLDATAKTIRNFFKRGGFNNQTDDSDSDDENAILADLKENAKTVEENGRITDDATLSDILEVDTELLIASYPTDEEILKGLMDNNEGQESDSYSENEDVIQPKPHRTEMLHLFETIKRGFQMEENVPDSIFSSLIKCENFYENLTSRNAKQYESEFNIFDSDRRIMVWRRKNEELNPKNLVGTVKYGGGGVLVWGAYQHQD
ncbi:hypothetical protein AVEN_40181-1 [Araneus ventricosus]|uniref:DDE-1 domain-containing protein n=1 Tax=Araneus ventricosus TaxID=182803 RepID=A0A4Y2X1G6_ARAVE|nr:hypothetical protein AVEN_40181-1 [Araneus ventricosus]